MENKKVTTILIALVVVVVVLFVVVKSLKHTTEPAATGSKQAGSSTVMQVKTTEVPTTQTPEAFPADIPIEKGAKILQNFNATAENGLFQASRVFETAKSPADNFKIYSDYIQNNGWKLVTSVNQEKLKVLSAQKGKGNLQISIGQNVTTKVNSVSITYSEQR